MISEHDAFAVMTDGLDRAIHGAKLIASFRRDQRAQWDKIAEALGVTKEAIYRLAGEGALRGVKQ